MICIWWIGETAPDDVLLAEVRTFATGEFRMPALLWSGRDRPVGTFDPARRQHSSREMLRWLLATRPAEAVRVLGVTDVDLFMPVLTFVFGEAQLDGVAAVVSTARLLDRTSAARTISRTVKECIHELGHTFGLTHCSVPTCVMARSTNVQAVDGKRPHLCEDCRARYAAALEDGLHV